MNHRRNIAFSLILASTHFFHLACAQTAPKTFLFVGSYTDKKVGEGIHVYEFDTSGGKLTEVEAEGNLINSSFLVLSPNGKYLYACTDTQLPSPGYVSAFVIDTLSGQISFLNKQITRGRNPVHVDIDKTGKYVVSSNYTDPLVNIFTCREDGTLAPFAQSFEFEGSSIHSSRQEKAHLHSSIFSPDNKYVFSPDLGSDKIRAFSFSEDGLLTIRDDLTVDTEKGTGPRHFTFHPSQKFAYSIEELSGTVAAYSYKNGKLKPIGSYFSYGKASEGLYASADIHVSPDGLFLYASNRLKEDNTISIFSVDQKKGTLKPVGHQSTFGERPRSFVIDPTGKFLIVANADSDSIVVLRRDEKTGLMTKTGDIIRVNHPASLKMRTYGK